MYHKVKNTLAGLGFVAAFVAGGLLLAEPVPAEPTPAARPEATQDARVALVVAEALRVAGHELAAADVAADALRERAMKARSTRLRLELGMPYYSFGAMLPRRGES